MKAFIILVVVLGISSCVSVSPHSVAAHPGAPASADVSDVSIPYDPEMKTWRVVIEPVSIADSALEVKVHNPVEGDSSVTITRTSMQHEQAEISAQLLSAFSGIGNIKVMDYGWYKSSATPTGAKKDVYLVRALMTEYATVSSSDSHKVHYFPLASFADDVREGMCAFDVSVVEAATGDSIGSMRASGTFASTSQTATQGVIVPLARQRQFAQSVLDQARRAALNDAAVRVRALLKARRS